MSKEIISRELLGEVLGCDVLDVDCGVLGSELFYNHSIGGECINIHELVHKCKEWIIKQKEVLLYEIRFLPVTKEIEVELVIHGSSDDFCVDFSSSNETDSIFKACQWILEKGE